MPVTKKPEQYVSRGKSFDTPEAAERHEALSIARERLEDAQDLFEKVLAENCTTADGHRFKFGVFHDYYQVFCPFHSMPYIRKFCFLCRNWAVRETDKPGVVEISEDPPMGRDSERRAWAPIKELYSSEKAANQALVVAQRAWLAEKSKQIADFAAKL